MAATDDPLVTSWLVLVSSAAMRDVSVKEAGGNEFTVEAMRRYENKAMKDFVDPEGNIGSSDAALKFAKEETTRHS